MCVRNLCTLTSAGWLSAVHDTTASAESSESPAGTSAADGDSDDASGVLELPSQESVGMIAAACGVSEQAAMAFVTTRTQALATIQKLATVRASLNYLSSLRPLRSWFLELFSAPRLVGADTNDCACARIRARLRPKIGSDGIVDRAPRVSR